MRQVTETFNVYNFNELDSKVQEKLMEKHRMWTQEEYSDWVFEPVLEEWKEKLEAIGFINPEIHFTVSYCQGDGASFDADCDFDALLKHLNAEYGDFSVNRQAKRVLSSLDGEIYKNHLATHWCHERTRNFTLEFPFDTDRQPRIARMLGELEKEIENLRLALSQELHSELVKAYEHTTTEEYIKEDLTEAGLEYKENGEIYI